MASPTAAPPGEREAGDSPSEWRGSDTGLQGQPESPGPMSGMYGQEEIRINQWQLQTRDGPL